MIKTIMPENLLIAKNLLPKAIYYFAIITFSTICLSSPVVITM